MALVKETVREAIKQAFVEGLKQTDPDKGPEVVAGLLADAVIAAIRSATITYTAGLVAPPAGGPVTGTFGCTIN